MNRIQDLVSEALRDINREVKPSSELDQRNQTAFDLGVANSKMRSVKNILETIQKELINDGK